MITMFVILLGMGPRRSSGLSHSIGGLFSSLVDVSYMCIVLKHVIIR